MLDQGRGGRYGWRLIRSRADGADVLARHARTFADPRACRDAIAKLGEDVVRRASVTRTSDGHFQWKVSGRDGLPLAESPAVFSGRKSCAAALNALRRELGGMHTVVLDHQRIRRTSSGPE